MGWKRKRKRRNPSLPSPVVSRTTVSLDNGDRVLCTTEGPGSTTVALEVDGRVVAYVSLTGGEPIVSLTYPDGTARFSIHQQGGKFFVGMNAPGENRPRQLFEIERVTE